MLAPAVGDSRRLAPRHGGLEEARPPPWGARGGLPCGGEGGLEDAYPAVKGSRRLAPPRRGGGSRRLVLRWGWGEGGRGCSPPPWGLEEACPPPWGGSRRLAPRHGEHEGAGPGRARNAGGGPVASGARSAVGAGSCRRRAVSLWVAARRRRWGLCRRRGRGWSSVVGAKDRVAARADRRRAEWQRRWVSPQGSFVVGTAGISTIAGISRL